jgi:hypothetical protein
VRLNRTPADAGNAPVAQALKEIDRLEGCGAPAMVERAGYQFVQQIPQCTTSIGLPAFVDVTEGSTATVLASEPGQ